MPAKTTMIWAPTKESYVEAELERCPRCKGFGGVVHKDGPCDLCAGQGKVYWHKPSGWTKAPYRRKTDVRIY